MFPAALAIVVQTFPLHERGKALAMFFGDRRRPHRRSARSSAASSPSGRGGRSSGSTSPSRSSPLIADRRLEADHGAPAGADGLPRARADRRAASALSVFGFQQSCDLGLEQSRHLRCASSPALALLVVFYFVELRTAVAADRRSASSGSGRSWSRTSCSASRCWCSSRCSSSPASTPRSRSASRPPQPSLVLLYFFLGFVIAAQIGGRMLDRVGAKRPVVLGCVAGRRRLLACGPARSPSSTSAPRSGTSSSPAPAWGSCSGRPAPTPSTAPRGSPTARRPGITQTVRNYAASLGLAILGTILVSQMHSHVTASLIAQGLPRGAGVGRGAATSPSRSRAARRRADPALRAARLRLRHPLGAARHGGDHGGGGDRGDGRAAARRPTRGGLMSPKARLAELRG